MKLRLAVLSMVLGTAILADGQTKVAPVVATNYVTAVQWFREVNGQLYNTSRSVLWKTFKGDITGVSSNQIVLRTFTIEPIDSATTPGITASNGYGSGPAQRRLVPTRVKTGEHRVYGRTIVIDGNWQSLVKFGLAVGESIRIRVMRIGTMEYKNVPTELWTVGKPHVVAVVTTNYPGTNLLNRIKH